MSKKIMIEKDKKRVEKISVLSVTFTIIISTKEKLKIRKPS